MTAAIATVRHAWDLGIRAFDTAPLYGYGASERRIGLALRDRPRDDFVALDEGRALVRAASDIPPGADVDRQRLGDREDAFYVRHEPVRLVFDYSADGVRRSLDESLERLGLDRIDIAFIHDPDDHWEAAIDGAWPALERLRSEGVVRAIGAGMNQSAMLARFARETDIDVVLLANRYTLLDQEALDDLAARLRGSRRSPSSSAGVMNSGILADPRPGSRFDYAPAPPEIVDACAAARRRSAPATAFRCAPRPCSSRWLTPPSSRWSPASGRIDHLDDYPAMLAHPIPADLWAELRAEGLIAPRTRPVPG